jgi:imidazolonepropionase-like amidohydrolase
LRQLHSWICLIFSLALVAPSMAAETKPKSTLIITNANMLDGKNEKLANGMSVLIEGNGIAKIAKSIPAPADATVIDAKGRTLMPGMIDNHWHSLFSTIPQARLLQADVSYINLYAAQGNRNALMRVAI